MNWPVRDRHNPKVCPEASKSPERKGLVVVGPQLTTPLCFDVEILVRGNTVDMEELRFGKILLPVGLEFLPVNLRKGLMGVRLRDRVSPKTHPQVAKLCRHCRR